MGLLESSILIYSSCLRMSLINFGECAMYDQDTVDLINHLIKIRLMKQNSDNRFLHASDFEEILEILIDKLPPPPNGIISRWKWSLGERKKLFEYLHEIGLDITESPVSLYS